MLKKKNNPPVINIVVNSPHLAFSLWVFPKRKNKKYTDTALNMGSKGYNTHNLRYSEGHTHSWSYFRSV